MRWTLRSGANNASARARAAPPIAWRHLALASIVGADEDKARLRARVRDQGAGFDEFALALPGRKPTDIAHEQLVRLDMPGGARRLAVNGERVELRRLDTMIDDRRLALRTWRQLL